MFDLVNASTPSEEDMEHLRAILRMDLALYHNAFNGRHGAS